MITQPISADQVAAFRRAWTQVNGKLPYLARVSDFNRRDGAFDMAGLRAADAEAQRRNDDAIRAALAAAQEMP